MGKVIVIEGSDGSGKATQTKLLYEALTAQGKKVKMVSYPCYESDSSAFNLITSLISFLSISLNL